ncbi:MAG: MBOAT family protein, partial [Oscillospiraceae bacterium]|nr:MBOAT family protein [Oscillospiraceae bacterium]
MSFGSLVFLVRFLPVSLLLYYICPRRFRNILLAVLSLFFYAWGDMTDLAVLAGTAVVGYAAALLITKSTGAKRKLVLAAGLVLVLGCLAVFKYTDLVLNTLSAAGVSVSPLGLIAPAGISFFSFTVAGYLIDVYKDDSDFCRSVPEYLVFVTFFPKLLMGPIVRYSEMKDALSERNVTSEDLEQGAVRFAAGLAKKVILADSIASLWNEVTGTGFENASCLLCWTGILAFGLQLYYDFSGYSDMALGLGRFFGFSLP